MKKKKEGLELKPLQTTEIKKGIYLNKITGTLFKTNTISINCFLKLDKSTSSAYAILPFLLKKRTKKINNLTQMGRTLMDLYGASLYVGCNKIGDNQVLSFSITVLDDFYSLNNENLTEKAVSILLDVFLKPYMEDGLFCDADISIEKENLIELIRSEFNDKRIYSISRCESLLCKEDPFGLNRYGNIEDIKKLTAKDVTDAYKQMISSANIQIMAILREENIEIDDKFIKGFKEVFRKDIHSIDTIKHKTKKHNEYVEKQNIKQAKLVMGFAAPISTPDDISAMIVANYLYGGTPISKLFMTVREKLSLCYYCASRYDQIKGIILVESGVEKENTQKAIQAILEQLDEIKKGCIDEQMLIQTKLAYLNLLNGVSDSPFGIESFYLKQIAMNKKHTVEKYMDEIKDVTIQDIIKVAQNIELNQTYILKGD